MTNLSIAPVPEALRHRSIRRLVGFLEVVEGLVADHDSEPIGVLRSVALEYRDRQVGTVLDQYRQVETGRAPPTTMMLRVCLLMPALGQR
jgi:hypothetical protein